jgi:hypothetical protein
VDNKRIGQLQFEPSPVVSSISPVVSSKQCGIAASLKSEAVIGLGEAMPSPGASGTTLLKCFHAVDSPGSTTPQARKEPEKAVSPAAASINEKPVAGKSDSNHVSSHLLHHPRRGTVVPTVKNDIFFPKKKKKRRDP